MKFKSLILGTLLLAGCSHDGNLYYEEDNDLSTNEGKTTLYVPPIEFVNGGQTTRTDLEINQGIASFKWAAGDEVGIFAFDGKGNKQGDQVYFTIVPDPADPQAAEAVFDGGGWQIKKDMNYIAYYPFIDKFRMDPTKIDVSFTGQAIHQKGDYAQLAKFDYMVTAPKQQAEINGGMHFQFKHLATLGVLRFKAASTEWDIEGNPGSGYFTRLDLIFPEDQKLFCETATLDLTKDQNALSVKTPTNKISIDLSGYYFNQLEQVEIPVLLGPTAGSLAGKTCVVEEHITNNHETSTRTSTLTFDQDLESGKGYFLDITFPKIDTSSNYIYSYQAGSLTLDRIYKAMNGGNKLRIEGEISLKEIDLLRQVAGAVAAQPTSRGTSTPLLTDLDLEFVYFLEQKTAGTNFYMDHVDFPSLAGTQLTRLSLPNGYIDLNAGIFNGVPLTTLEWYYSPFEFENKLDAKAFDGLKTEECDLRINNKKGQMYQFISSDAEGNMLFNGCRFKSIKHGERDWSIYPEVVYTYHDIETAKVDAEAHSVDVICAGLLKAETITQALNGGGTLKVTGKLNERDLKTIASYDVAAITSLTFDNIGTYVPSDNVFEGCTYSANCSLVIPDEWKDKASATTDGAAIFGGVAWKSVTTTTGISIGDLIDEDVL